MRTFINKPGTTYDELKTTVIFAEDMNEIKTRLDNVRIWSDAGNGPVVFNTDNYEHIQFVAWGTTLSIPNPSGTYKNGQKLLLELEAQAGDCTLSFGDKFVSGGVDIPTTITDDKRLTLGFIYSTLSVLNKWRLVASTVV